MGNDKEWAELELRVIEELVNQTGETDAVALRMFLDSAARMMDQFQNASNDGLIDLFKQYSVDDEWDGGKSALQQWRFQFVERALRLRLKELTK
jgi:hypothetical protein